MSQILKWSSMAAVIITGWIGNIPDVVKVLIVLMFLDILAGVVMARSLGKLSPSQAWNGVGKKVMTMILVGLAYISSGSLFAPEVGIHFGSAAAGFFAIAESISILEKAERIGIPIPDFLREGFARLESKDSEKSAKKIGKK